MSQTHSIQNHMSFLHVKFIHLWIYQNMGLTASLRERGFVIMPPYIYPGGFDEVEWDFNKSPRVLLIDFKQFMSWVCCLKVMRNILVKAQKYYSGQDSLIEIFLVAFQNGCFPLWHYIVLAFFLCGLSLNELLDRLWAYRPINMSMKFLKLEEI